MRVALVELYVALPPRRRGAPAPSAEAAVARALRRDPARREELALEAIAVAGAAAPEVILCPGWTFVGEPPPDARLADAAGSAAVVLEVLAADGPGAADTGSPLPWRTLVLEDGALRETPAQALVAAGDLDGEEPVAALARALVDPARRVRGAALLVDAEVNVVRRRTGAGGVSYRWDTEVGRAGAPAATLRGALVLNPAHLPAGTYVLGKRRAGPWRALATTANAFDALALGLKPPPAPMRVVASRRDLALPEAVPLSDGRSRVVVVEVNGARGG